MLVMKSGRLEPDAGTGPRTTSAPYYFDREVRASWVALTGYQLAYSGDDHHVQTISVELSSALRETEFGRGVVVEASLLLRDDNGDDPFSGWVDYLLFVELSDSLIEAIVEVGELVSA